MPVMLKNITAVELGLLGIGFYLLRAYLRKVNTPAPLPPGPQGLPVVGVSLQSKPMYVFSSYRNVECCRHAREEGVVDFRRMGSQVG
jgi:hypothetical protein